MNCIFPLGGWQDVARLSWNFGYSFRISDNPDTMDGMVGLFPPEGDYLPIIPVTGIGPILE